MLCAVGDLIEDVVVQLHDEIQSDSDTPATIARRRGGSAANVAYFAAKLYGRARFVGCVGADPLGDSLIGQLTARSVDVRGERRGRTGSIVVLATTDGVRTMLTDRGDATNLSTFDSTWLDDVDTLHLPLYSFSHEPLASTTREMVRDARQRNIRVSVDLSSVTVISDLGIGVVTDLLGSLRPDVLLCTRMEADAIGLNPTQLFESRIVVVKNGAHPVIVFGENHPEQSYALQTVDTVVDGTGAGDAFAAGFLGEMARGRTIESCVTAGHDVAARVVVRAGATLED